MTRNSTLISNLENQVNDLEQRIREFQVEVHKKYAIAVACLIFVFLGIPIGMMIKSSGVGVAISASALIFVFYYICLVMGEQFGDKGTLSPWLAMWAPNIIFGSIGLYLVVSSTRNVSNINLAHIKDIVNLLLDRLMQKRT
jgi:lipopolysaccharide export system permease protein